MKNWGKNPPCIGDITSATQTTLCTGSFCIKHAEHILEQWHLNGMHWGYFPCPLTICWLRDIFFPQMDSEKKQCFQKQMLCRKNVNDKVDSKFLDIANYRTYERLRRNSVWTVTPDFHNDFG